MTIGGRPKRLLPPPVILTTPTRTYIHYSQNLINNHHRRRRSRSPKHHLTYDYRTNNHNNNNTVATKTKTPCRYCCLKTNTTLRPIRGHKNWKPSVERSRYPKVARTVSKKYRASALEKKNEKNAHLTSYSVSYRFEPHFTVFTI